MGPTREQAVIHTLTLEHTRDSNESRTVAIPNLSGPEANEHSLLIPDQFKGCQPEYAVHIKYTQILISDFHSAASSVADGPAASASPTISCSGISLADRESPTHTHTVDQEWS